MLKTILTIPSPLLHTVKFHLLDGNQFHQKHLIQISVIFLTGYDSLPRHVGIIVTFPHCFTYCVLLCLTHNVIYASVL